MRLHEADPDVVAYQEIRLKGKDNIVRAQMYDKEGREYQREWAQGMPLLVRRGLSVVQDKKVGARGRRAVYDVATEHGQVVIINCHVPQGRTVKEYVAQLRMEYIRALEKGPVFVVGDFNYHPRRRGTETEVDRKVRMFVEEMRLQDVSYSGAPGPSHIVVDRSGVRGPQIGQGGNGGVYGGAGQNAGQGGALPHDGDSGREGLGSQGMTRRMSKGRTKKASACRQGSSRRRRGKRGGSSGDSRCTSKWVRGAMCITP